MEQKQETDLSNRRPLTTRSASWAKWLANVLVAAHITPNTISLISIVFAALGAYFGMCLAPPLGWILMALCVQLRLLCNMLDGMVAIEGKKQSASGALFNEIPDRIADSVFIIALGYMVQCSILGWYGALVAAITAYIRVLGGSLGLAQDFRGPMAKPHRMAVITAGCVLGAIETYCNNTQWLLVASAWIVAIGATVTCMTRTLAITKQLQTR